MAHGPETAVPEMGHGAVAVHKAQIVAVLEALCLKGAEGGGQDKTLDAVAVVEGLRADLPQGIAEVDVLELFKLVEGLGADAADPAGEHHTADFVLVFLPGAAVLHVAAAGDGEGVILQNPGQPLAAGALRLDGGCQHPQGQNACEKKYENGAQKFFHMGSFLSEC